MKKKLLFYKWWQEQQFDVRIMNLTSFLIYHAKFYILWVSEVTSALPWAIKLWLLLLLFFMSKLLIFSKIPTSEKRDIFLAWRIQGSRIGKEMFDLMTLQATSFKFFQVLLIKLLQMDLEVACTAIINSKVFLSTAQRQRK